jgi:hypothetical protein
MLTAYTTLTTADATGAVQLPVIYTGVCQIQSITWNDTLRSQS